MATTHLSGFKLFVAIYRELDLAVGLAILLSSLGVSSEMKKTFPFKLGLFCWGHTPRVKS